MRASHIRATCRVALVALCVIPGVGAVAGPASARAPVEVVLPQFYGAAADMVAGGGHIFVSQGYEGTGVVVTDYDGANATTIGGLPGPTELSFNADQTRLIVSIVGAVAVIDTTTLTEVARYDVTSVVWHPRGTVAVGSYIWFSHEQHDQDGVSVIDTAAQPPTVTAVLTTGLFDLPLLIASPSTPDRLTIVDGGYGYWKSYTVAGATLTERAAVSDRCRNVHGAAASADGTFIVAACETGPEVIDADDLSVRRSVTASGTYMRGAAVAPDGRHFAVGLYSGALPYDVQAWATTGGSTLLDDFGDESPSSKAVAFPPGTSSLVALSEVWSGNGTNLYRLHIYPYGGLDSAEVSVSAPATAPLDTEITLTGQLTFPAGGAVDSPQVLHVARRNYDGSTTTLPDVVTDATGAYSTTDIPLGGRNRYSVTWDGDADHGPATGYHIVTVDRLATTVSVTTSASPVTYGKSVVVSARLGAHHAGNTLKIYATPIGGSKKLIKSGPVDSKGYLRITYRPLRRTTYTATFAGDDRYASRTATRAQYVRVAVALTGYRYYARSSGWLVYRVTATPRFVGRVTPNKGDSLPIDENPNVRWYLERYVSGRWRQAAALTDELTGRSTSQVFITGGHITGSRWRVRVRHAGDRYHAANTSPWIRFRYTS
jgi:hypothetical protein